MPQLHSIDPVAGESCCPETILPESDSRFLSYVRGLAIMGIVLGHLGGWILPPYTEFIGVVVPVFFFLSGAVSYYSFCRSPGTARYLQKRIVSLLVPYYLAAGACILVHIIRQWSLPHITLDTAIDWLTIRPTRELMGFPFGQTWFLHTLGIIVLVSPLYFTLYARRPGSLLILLCVPLALSGVPLIWDLHAASVVFGHNLYRPIVHSFFFVAGFGYFSAPASRDRRRSLPLLAVVAGVLLSAALVVGLDLEVDYKYHTHSPDLYYLAGSAAAIGAILLAQQFLLGLCARASFVASLLRFMDRYTFGIFLLHSFAIWWVEEYLGLVSPKRNYVLYAVVKFGVVMALTCVLAVPFTKVSDWLVDKCLRRRRRPGVRGQQAIALDHPA